MKLLLTTLHAKFVHASLALPCLAAACRDVAGMEIEIREYSLKEAHERTLRSLAAAEADVVAFSTYIWNVEAVLRLAGDLKKIRPRTFIILGGPEVSYGAFELLERNSFIDCIIRGEGEGTLLDLVKALSLAGTPSQALERVTEGLTFRSGEDLVALPERPPLADLDTIPSPFAMELVDIKKPLVYYETSRGCPFSCAFCLSSVEQGVRSFSRQRIERDLSILMQRQVGTVKLVDRTFNYDPRRASHIWSYILQHNRCSSFHFEIAADLLTDDNLRLLRRVPAGMFRFEIGVQSENEATLTRVGRKSDLKRLFSNVHRLRRETQVTLHLDLVAGLPHEDLEGFLGSLGSLLELSPHHIQVEPLKVLKGSPMRRIAADEEYRFSDYPPYKILETPWLSFSDVTRIETVSRLLDLYYNSGRFAATLATLASLTPLVKFFADLASFWEEEDIAGSLPLHTLFDLLWRFFGRYPIPRRNELGEALSFDYCMAEYPVRFPSFFPRDMLAEKPSRTQINGMTEELSITSESRVRTLAARFTRDYRELPPLETPVTLLFLYVSAPGKKMEVRLLQL
ncbi:B12-binding domain-containing radical SAM protein [Geobacter sp. DSM 9736]|uniref:B12-binding domain-containing radical SAM protein n=1 Tax=Geobacter sp. DSM 9736 TaxID=1277350 RepID=UPI000B506011|nr:B12-binding domain-containing radical SAM protein [Geobacter sp. DSM 9736]SNB47956.1 anaerobic magnesium-protoporphyrin IX monomethyl ester cyclase [Geobacter sp. DSM 9736]